MSAYLHHLTIDTGQLVRSPRAAVDDEVLDVIAQRLRHALASGEVEPFDAPQPLGLKAIAAGRALVCTLYLPLSPREAAIADSGAAPWEPLATMGVAPKAKVAPRLWDELMGMPGARLHPGLMRPAAPWAAVVCHPALDQHPAIARWIADAERMLAWAWIEGERL